MDDEVQYSYQNNILRQNASYQRFNPAETFNNQQNGQDFNAFSIKSKQRFPFKISCLECIGQKIILGSNQGSLYLYCTVQNNQTKNFKLISYEPNAHPRSQVLKLLDVSEQKPIQNDSRNTQSNTNLNLNFNRTQESLFHDHIYNYNNQNGLFESKQNLSNMFNNDFSTNLGQNKPKKASNRPLKIVSCGLYDRKLMLWEINGKFEKIAQSQMFKTLIYSLSFDGNFVFVATFWKIYALNLTNLSICMKFGVPNYKDMEFQISSVAYLPLQNSNILIAGTDNYRGNNQFLSLWEYPKDLNIIQKDLEESIEEEDESQNTQAQPVINDIEDLDNFDLDGDFNEAPAVAEVKPKKKKRLSFWKPVILEHCHSTRIRQLKCFQNSPQFISVSVLEINIWRIADGNQVQPLQQINYQNQMSQQIGFNNASPNLTNNNTPGSLKTEVPAVQQVFSLKFNKDRRIYTNAVIEKKTNNILLFVDSEVLCFESSNFKLKYHQNLHSPQQTSQLYLNSSNNSYNSNNEELGSFQQMYPHNNHYVLVSEPNLNTQFDTKYTIAVCEFESNSHVQSNKNTMNSEVSFNNIQNLNQGSNAYNGDNYNINSDFYQNNNSHSSQEAFSPIHESRIEEEEEDIQMSPKLTSRKKKLQSPIIKPLSQIPTSVPPVLKYSTAHLIPSTASYTILMNKLKQIEQTNNAQKMNNQQQTHLRRPSQSSTNIPAITFRKPYTNGPRSNSKCIKKQLKRHVKYCNKKKKMKQNLVKAFANQNNLNTQKKDINSQSLTLVQTQSNNPQSTISQIGFQTMQQPSQEQHFNTNQYYQHNNINQLNTNTNGFSTNNISKSNKKTPQTFILAQDSESSIGLYSIL